MHIVIAIIIAGVAVYYYFVAMGWLFTNVVPDMAALISVAGTIAVAVIYGRAALRVFTPPAPAPADPDDPPVAPPTGVRTVAGFGLAVVMLVWVTADFLFIVSRIGLDLFPTATGQFIADLSAAMIQPSLELLGLHQAESSNSIAANALADAAAKSAVLAAGLMIARGTRNTQVDGTEPATLHYFYRQAYQDLHGVVTDACKVGAGVVVLSYMGVTKALKSWATVAIWPLCLSAYVALLVPAITGGVALLLLSTLHLIGAGVVIAAAMFMSLALFCMERAVVLARSGYVKCPHAGCHEPVALPVVLCPSCNQRHERLVPGRYGVFRRDCICGKASLPTLFLAGKLQLPHVCPHCAKPLSSRLFAASVHVPIYGGSSAGKTMFLMASTVSLVEGRMDGSEAQFIDADDEKRYRSRWKPSFDEGRAREKTTRLLPDAFLLSLRRSLGMPVSLYMYDPAGEAMEREDELAGHKFLRYFDGLALLIDPLSLPSLASAWAAEHGNAPASTSVADPLEVVHHIVNVLESQATLQRGKQVKRRIAVILTKMDRPFIQKQIGVEPARNVPADWRESGKVESDLIRSWFQRNEPALVQALETRFADLRFFAVSALGHEVGAPGAFQPQGVLAPVTWLLSTRFSLRRPMLSKVLLSAAEVAAGAAVLLCFAAIPIAGVVGAGNVGAVPTGLPAPAAQGANDDHHEGGVLQAGLAPPAQPDDSTAPNESGVGQDRSGARISDPAPAEGRPGQFIEAPTNPAPSEPDPISYEDVPLMAAGMDGLATLLGHAGVARPSALLGMPKSRLEAAITGKMNDSDVRPHLQEYPAAVASTAGDVTLALTFSRGKLYRVGREWRCTREDADGYASAVPSERLQTLPGGSRLIEVVAEPVIERLYLPLGDRPVCEWWLYDAKLDGGLGEHERTVFSAFSHNDSAVALLKGEPVDRAAAAVSFRKALEVLPSYVPAAGRLCEVLIEIGDYDGARDACQRAAQSRRSVWRKKAKSLLQNIP